MVSLDIQYHAHFGMQIQKASVVFACLCHEKLAVAHPARTAKLRYIRADDKAGIKPRRLENISKPCACRTLAMRTANRHPRITAHHLPQHLGILINLESLLFRRHQLSISLFNRRRYHYRVDLADYIFLTMADIDNSAFSAQFRHNRTVVGVRAADQCIVFH